MNIVLLFYLTLVVGCYEKIRYIYILRYIFKTRHPLNHNLRHNPEFRTPQVNSVYSGTESISFLGSKIYHKV